MGGDHAPDEVVTGALLYARAHPSEEVLLIGDEDRVRAVSGDLPINATVIHAAQVVGMEPMPSSRPATQAPASRLQS